MQMTAQTMTSRVFNQDTSRAKKAASDGPVIITDRGRPAHVLLTYQAYQRLVEGSPTLSAALYMPGVAEIELDLVLPLRGDEVSRDVDLS